MDARLDRCIRFDFRGDCLGPVQLNNYVYRTVDGYFLGALAGAFLGPFFWGLFSGKISKASVWVSFILGVGLTTSNMFIGFIASPINCGAIAMLLSLVVVPLVSLFTPKVPFNVKPPRTEGAIDREYVSELKGSTNEL